MKSNVLLLFYFVPWLAAGTKITLHLDNAAFVGAGFFVIGAVVLYMGWFGFLAFQWGRGKKLWLLLLGCVMQYAANAAAGRLLLGEELWQMELAVDMIYPVCCFWQAALFFCGRKENLRM